MPEDGVGAGGTEDRGVAELKADPDGAEGVERWRAARKSVAQTERAGGTREPGEVIRTMVSGGAVGGRSQGGAGDQKTQSKSTQWSGVQRGAEGLKGNSGCGAEEPDDLGRGGRGRLGGSSGVTEDFELGVTSRETGDLELAI